MRPALAIASALLVATGLAACGEKDEPESVAPTMDGQQSAQATTTTTEPNGGGGGQKQPSLEEEIETTVAAVLGGRGPELLFRPRDDALRQDCVRRRTGMSRRDAEAGSV